MSGKLTTSEKLERFARFSEKTRVIVRCMRHTVGLSETPLRFRARNLIEQRLRAGGFTQRGLDRVYVEERFPGTLRSFRERRLRQPRQEKEYEEAPAEEKTKPRKEPEKELKFDLSPIFY